MDALSALAALVDDAGVQRVAFLLAAAVGLVLSVIERRAAHRDNAWRGQLGIDGVLSLVGANAIEQETMRCARMVLWGAVAVGSMLRVASAALFLGLIAAVLVDAWTAQRKARLRRRIRALELAKLGAVVRLEGERAWAMEQRDSAH